ncbi:MAG TPA: agmatinase [Patescibacteria group bacterium]|nr:agmatinase [Patescibacteria group bacterium]
MIDSIINCNKKENADCIILTAGYDRTSSLGKGAKDGGLAIVKSLREDIEFLDRFSMTEPGYIFKIAHYDLDICNELAPEQMVDRISNKYLELINDRQFLMLLGGDHSVSAGAFKAISEKLKPDDITIFQIDAHCDLRNDDFNSNPDQSCISKYSHACVMRRAFEMGFNIVQVGVRSFSKEEYDFYKKNNKKISVFEWGKGKIPPIKELIESVKTKRVYISLDVDGIDPAHMPATGTPVQGGLEWYYTINLLLSLIKEKEIIGADIVEMIPKENDYLTQFGAAQLCYNIISSNLLKRKNKI